MKHLLFSILFTSAFSFAQNVQVDSATYTAQQLIEDILIDSNCITDVVVTNVVGGNFGGTDQSFGYFDANNSSFPFANGIVLSTGKLTNVQGPNTSLSDDDATNWTGDSDLETILNETNTLNATIIEFEFKSVASQISFNYVFASEEYQENNSSTCQYSDLFGFLIKEKNATYFTNIALVPNTQTPVKVTTVHPEIPNSCSAQNESYFGSWNDASAPINFNGQTAVLTAIANTIPNETYHVKLVIADEQNYRYDSAVFLEAGSFKLSTDLGEDRLIDTNNPLCENETLTLDASQLGNNTYKWFKDGAEIIGAIDETFTVEEAGTYNVEVELQGQCTSYGEITIEYFTPFTINNLNLSVCDDDSDGYAIFNLDDLKTTILTNFQEPPNINFYTDITESDEISGNYQNTQANSQTIYVKIKNDIDCYELSPITLQALEVPQFLNTETYTYCVNTYPDTITIDSGIINADDNTTSYQWFLNNTEISQSTASIQINEAGTYTVIATFLNGCSASNSITVNTSSAAVIEDIIFTEGSTNNTISVVVSGAGNYEYVLNNAPPQQNNTFTNVQAGLHTISIYDTNGCESIETEVSVFGFPNFFTPNNDGINDTWNVIGLSTEINANIYVQIFNRYGKLLKQINPLIEGWDGLYQGQILPNDDYWFYLQLPDGKTYKGHFSLKH
ncbi:T9SS type B sorting domain-containing protein [Tamlana sp. 62-3]|uniref:T9SS type B sorting domain-containing protein n=1 Tax=Neotamlana sargassicola TaxID=2883125 RepID=A0A9X1L5E5_9FLAO|nr:choice-of-anchor L domain-containing protein [Tamlana sargassicola]MCB4809167.1 T9SS type B sorting domain-containing protein [Tamlana sargassicola]